MSVRADRRAAAALRTLLAPRANGVGAIYAGSRPHRDQLARLVLNR